MRTCRSRQHLYSEAAATRQPEHWAQTALPTAQTATEWQGTVTVWDCQLGGLMTVNLWLAARACLHLLLLLLVTHAGKFIHQLHQLYRPSTHVVLGGDTHPRPGMKEREREPACMLVEIGRLLHFSAFAFAFCHTQAVILVGYVFLLWIY